MKQDIFFCDCCGARMFNVKYEKPFYVLFVISFKLALAIFPHDYYVRFNMIRK